MTETSDTRRFRVWSRHEDVHHGRVIEEPTFEAAAISYVEHMPHHADQRSEVGVIVQELATGHEHSFLIHLDAGEASLA